MTSLDRMPTTDERPRNRLLAHCAASDYAKLRPHLKPVFLPQEFILYASRGAMDFVYFPESGVASLVVTMANGKTAEVGTVGNEGFVGLPVLFGESVAHVGVFMQVAGTGLRMPSVVFRNELQHSDTLRNLFFSYAGVFFDQTAQSAACAFLHSLEQRCCRWLVATADRMPSEQFALTQEFLAMMLGVRRSSVSVVMGDLQRRGLVRYSRGRVTILDRKSLQAMACECYHVIKAEAKRPFAEDRRV